MIIAVVGPIALACFMSLCGVGIGLEAVAAFPGGSSSAAVHQILICFRQMIPRTAKSAGLPTALTKLAELASRESHVPVYRNIPTLGKSTAQHGAVRRCNDFTAVDIVGSGFLQRESLP